MVKIIPGKASIIIRTRNEERWIKHCLDSVFDQDYKSGYEVIIIDNNSTDCTLDIVNRYSVKTIINIRKYLPGKAINVGIEQSEGEFIVCLSAHCIPKSNSWLNNLIRNFTDDKIVGIYGRQIPVSFSHPSDIRELFISFGLERRVQKKDTFFHNANSVIRRKTLNIHQFDNTVTNIEDRLWAKTVIDDGFHLVYEPEAEVYHFHGIHQAQDQGRALSTFAVMNEQKEFFIEDLLPESLKPENREVSSIIPIPNKVSERVDHGQIVKFFNEIKDSRFIKSYFVLYDDDKLVDICKSFDFMPIKRAAALNEPDVTLETVLKWGLNKIEKLNINPEVILYADLLYYFRPPNLFDKLINDFCYKGVDTVFVGYVDYHNYWIHDENEGYMQVGEGFTPRTKRHPIYQAVYGLGCLTYASIISRDKLVGEKVGIVPINNILYTLKASDDGHAKLFNLLEQIK
tara:strand:+ start:9174 stop:10544 length:1371 start_codon:yes stop_codon:yes gene_type:complete